MVYTQRDDGNYHYVTHNELQVATGDFIRGWGRPPFLGSQTLQLFDLCQQDRLDRFGTYGLLARASGGWLSTDQLTVAHVDEWK